MVTQRKGKDKQLREDHSSSSASLCAHLISEGKVTLKNIISFFVPARQKNKENVKEKAKKNKPKSKRKRKKDSIDCFKKKIFSTKSITQIIWKLLGVSNQSDC